MEFKLTNKIVVPSNVLAFLDRAAFLHGQSEAQKFAGLCYSEIHGMPIGSPIEQLFFIAASSLAASVGQSVNPDTKYNKNGREINGDGLFITPQYQIAKYRADFLLSQSGNGPEGFYTPVIVELDGHQFHDRDKRQRSYEKARDRHFVKEGYRVVHYTGSDVVADPFKVAWEVLEMLGVFIGSGRESYDPKDPMGLNDA